MSTAYNPANEAFYVIALEKCNIYTKSSAWWEPGKSFYGGGTRRVPDETPQKVLRAIDTQNGKIVWEYPAGRRGRELGRRTIDKRRVESSLVTMPEPWLLWTPPPESRSGIFIQINFGSRRR